MSYLRRAKTTCGRYAKKPNERDDNLNYEDDTSIPLQDQIDNLRTKISLKEKYNKALMEEVFETNQGAATMITDLTKQNKQLREDLINEKNAEQTAVKKALRSYRLFQLAVLDKNSEAVVNWLDDKIFDASKTLNLGTYLLRKMQNKLAEAESSVRYLEKCPVPGTEAWEKKMEDDRIAITCALENGKANRDAVVVLNKKYREILYYLKAERGKWPHIMGSMEKTFSSLQTELNGLETMLEDAIRFREEAREKLKLTEEEASANRKQRRLQMNKMKKSVEKALQQNTTKYAQPQAASSRKVVEPTSTTSNVTSNGSELAKSYNDIKRKQFLVQDFEDRANKLVQAMCVPDLRFCPARLLTVRKVGEMLSQELNMKAEAREILLKHKYRMELILRHFRYTGRQRDEAFELQVEERNLALMDTENKMNEKQTDTNLTGDILTTLRMGMIGIDELFNQGKRKPRKKDDTDAAIILKKLFEKIKELVQAVNDLKSLFPESSKQQRSYAPYIKYNIPARFIRVGAAEEMDLEDDSDQEPTDDVQSKILTREELKTKSEKIRSQGMLRKGKR